MLLGRNKQDKPEVFFCTCGSRDGLAEKMREHWLGLNVNLRVITPKILGCDNFSFQKIRRAAAEVMAKSEIYILADDDCSLITPLELGIQALRSRDDFALVSAFPANCNIERWTPEDHEPYEDMNLMEHYSTGGIRIIRRGCMVKGWPEQVRVGYDSEHCEALRSSGYRVGYAQHCRMEHWGEGKSSIWPNPEISVLTSESV